MAFTLQLMFSPGLRRMPPDGSEAVGAFCRRHPGWGDECVRDTVLMALDKAPFLSEPLPPASLLVSPGLGVVMELWAPGW